MVFVRFEFWEEHELTDRSGSYEGKCCAGKQDVWRIRRQTFIGFLSEVLVRASQENGSKGL